MECAIALQQAFAARNETADERLDVRVGLNAGEPIEEDGDFFRYDRDLEHRASQRRRWAGRSWCRTWYDSSWRERTLVQRPGRGCIEGVR